MADMLDLPENPSFEDLEKELIYQNIMMDELDPEAVDYIQQRADAEEKIEHLNRMLGIDNETLSQGGISQEMLSPNDIMSPGTMSQGTLSQESWEHMPLQQLEDTSNNGYGGNQFGYTDLNGMATNTNNGGGGGNDYNWMLEGMYAGEFAVFSYSSAS
jgi:hypothetical protein